MPPLGCVYRPPGANGISNRIKPRRPIETHHQTVVGTALCTSRVMNGKRKKGTKLNVGVGHTGQNGWQAQGLIINYQALPSGYENGDMF